MANFYIKIHSRSAAICQTICGSEAVKIGKDFPRIIAWIKVKMSVQYSDKSANNYSSTTTTNASMKTPFGIEDILLINNNNNCVQSANKNCFNVEKSCGKSSVKSNEAEEFRKILSSDR